VKKSAVVIGSGPNGLSAAIVLARAGWAVTVYEGAETIGGGARSAELTLPGFTHDICSAVHPMAASSPCFEDFDLHAHGLDWVQPGTPLAHPFDDGIAATIGEDPEWEQLVRPFVQSWERLRHDIMAPLGVPRHPLLMARFGWEAIRPARSWAESRLHSARSRALFAGIAAHAALPLETPLSASIGLVLGICAHAVGWPFPRGGSQQISNALAACLRAHGGKIVTGIKVTTVPDARIVLADITPRQMLSLAGDRLPGAYREALARYRYGPGAFKLDWALDGPIPWSAPECSHAGTVHLGGSLDEIAQWERTHTGRPFVLLAQPSLFDETRAPRGKHTAWAYCHVPNGSTLDMTAAIEDQVERFAPGFRERILARSVRTPADLQAYNPNLIGGDFNGGAMTPRQFFIRPAHGMYRTPVEGLYFCSASTPPGGAVHGMCGYHAARLALRSI
jgi:phytoene dehydrogenase-like protein